MGPRPRSTDLIGRAAAAAALAACLFSTSDEARAATPPAAAQRSALDQGAEVLLRALSLLGVNYRWGGDTPESGVDCSGLVRLVFHEAIGLVLPRRSEEMSREGNEIRIRDLRPGDLVFFNTLQRAFSHVGIYIGDRQFAHAPATGGAVRVERIDQQYWNRRFDGARRLLALDTQADLGHDPTAAIVSPGRSQPSPQSWTAAAAGGDTASTRPGSPAPASWGRLTVHELDSIGGS